MGTYRRRLKHWIFKLIRPIFVSNVDSNEDYFCMICGEPVLYRDLFCGDPGCARKAEFFMSGEEDVES